MTMHAVDVTWPIGPVGGPLGGRGMVKHLGRGRPVHLRPVAPPAVGRRREWSVGARLVRTLVVFGLLCLLLLSALARLSMAALPPTHEVTVGSGQTLSSIAAEELPMLPLGEAMLRIRQANGLNSSVLMTGQRLVVPGED